MLGYLKLIIIVILAYVVNADLMQIKSVFSCVMFSFGNSF